MSDNKRQMTESKEQMARAEELQKKIKAMYGENKQIPFPRSRDRPSSRMRRASIPAFASRPSKPAMWV